MQVLQSSGGLSGAALRLSATALTLTAAAKLFTLDVHTPEVSAPSLVPPTKNGLSALVVHGKTLAAKFEAHQLAKEGSTVTSTVVPETVTETAPVTAVALPDAIAITVPRGKDVVNDFERLFGATFTFPDDLKAGDRVSLPIDQLKISIDPETKVPYLNLTMPFDWTIEKLCKVLELPVSSVPEIASINQISDPDKVKGLRLLRIPIPTQNFDALATTTP